MSPVVRVFLTLSLSLVVAACGVARIPPQGSDPAAADPATDGSATDGSATDGSGAENDTRQLFARHASIPRPVRPKSARPAAPKGRSRPVRAAPVVATPAKLGPDRIGRGLVMEPIGRDARGCTLYRLRTSKAPEVESVFYRDGLGVYTTDPSGAACG